MQRRDQDRIRRQAHPWRKLYDTKGWKARRLEQLERQPFCERCQDPDNGGRLVRATVANHRVPHRGDVELFFSGALQSLCKPCHDKHAQRDDLASDD